MGTASSLVVVMCLVLAVQELFGWPVQDVGPGTEIGISAHLLMCHVQVLTCNTTFGAITAL